MNLLRKLTATTALVALVSGLFTTGVSAMDNDAVMAANKLAEAGIVVNHSDNTELYELNRTVLRQEIAAVARGIAGVDKTTTCENLFEDVSATNPNDWACYTVEALRKANLIAANKKFNPEQNITKAEAVGMMVKAAYGDEYNYDSSKEDSWQKQVVEFAVSKGMVNSFSDYNTSATRGFVFKAGYNGLSNKEGANNGEDPNEVICQLLGTCGDKDTTNTDEPKEPKKEDKENNITLNKDVLVVELSPETPEDGNVAAGSARTKMLGFDVTAGNADVTLKNVELKFTGLGNSKYIKDLAIYSGLQKVTKGNKKFQSDDSADLTFEKDTVIKAGETKTLFVTATIDQEASNYNQTLRINLVDLEASSTVEGDNLVGSTLTPVLVSNVAKVELKSVNKITNTINVGEVATLAEFSLDETSDKEGVTVKSITMQLDGSFDTDDLGDLALYADGTKIDATFKVKNSELEIELDQVIEKDKKVKFQLKGSVSGSVNDDMMIEFEADAIYAIGNDSEVSISIDTTNNGANKELAKIDIEGSEINIAFNRNDKDEAKPGADDVELATIDLSSVSDYTISELTITVKNNAASAKTIDKIVKNLELDNNTSDKVTGENTTTAVYTFEDIDLSAGETKKLPLVLDVVNDASINGAELEIDLDVLKIKDEDNNKTYTTAVGEYNVSKILSNNSFTTKKLDIKSASLEIASTQVNDTKLVLGNGIKTVLYKAKLSVGDADSIVLSDLNLEKSGDYSATVAVNDIISDATLNIGGKTFKGDVETATIEFNNINANIAAGADNVEMLVVATLKNNEDAKTAPNNVIGFQLQTSSIDADDSEGDEVLASELNLTNANTNLTKTTLNDKGTFMVKAITNGDHKDDMKDVVLAGTSKVNLGEVEIQADQEDAQVKRLTFEVDGGSAGNANLPVSGTSIDDFTMGHAQIGTPVGNVQVQKVTLSEGLLVGDWIVATAGSTTKQVMAGSDNSKDTLEALGTELITDAKVDAYSVSADGLTLTLESHPNDVMNLRNVAVNPKDTNRQITTTIETVAAKAIGSTATLNFGAPLQANDIVEFKTSVAPFSYTTAAGTIADVANQIDTNKAALGLASVTVNGNTIELVGLVANPNLTITDFKVLRSQPVKVDLSSTFKNVKLMDGSKVLADNATLSYNGSKTLITFKDFTLAATDNSIDAMLVADLAKYTTSGSETSAKLGDFTISAYNGPDKDLLEVKGESSQETYAGANLNVTPGTTVQVSIVPAIVTVSVDNKFGNDDKVAIIKFAVDKGNNTINNNDITVESIKLKSNLEATHKMDISNDDDDVVYKIALGGDTGNYQTNIDKSINNNDKWELELTAGTSSNTIRIAAGNTDLTKAGITYKIDGNEYSINNTDSVDLGSYSN